MPMWRRLSAAGDAELQIKCSCESCGTSIRRPYLQLEESAEVARTHGRILVHTIGRKKSHRDAKLPGTVGCSVTSGGSKTLGPVGLKGSWCQASCCRWACGRGS